MKVFGHNMNDYVFDYTLANLNDSVETVDICVKAIFEMEKLRLLIKSG